MNASQSGLLLQSSPMANLFAWVKQQSVQSQAQGIPTPYVTLDKSVFHVHDSPFGNMVSRLHLDFDSQGNAAPKLNPFTVTAEERDLVLEMRGKDTEYCVDNTEKTKRKGAGMFR